MNNKDLDDYVDCMLINEKHVKIKGERLTCKSTTFESESLSGVPDGDWWAVVCREQNYWVLALVNKSDDKHVISAGEIT